MKQVTKYWIDFRYAGGDNLETAQTLYILALIRLEEAIQESGENRDDVLYSINQDVQKYLNAGKWKGKNNGH